MARTQLDAALAAALTDRQLLEHPFYRRWQAGSLAPGELARYAEQYRYVEASLPGTLEAIARSLPAGTSRSLVEANLHDELGEPRAHVEIFEGFAAAVGAEAGAAATAKTKELVATYEAATTESPLAALGVLAAYECQAAAIAQSKGEGLRAHYGCDASATEFWDLHATMESDHASWTLEAIEAIEAIESAGTDSDAAAEIVAAAMRRGAEAWWEWLSEREAEHAAAAA
ncbi:MAG: iron-containing redox enzyme family protein [Acidimicrobiales bacterium]